MLSSSKGSEHQTNPNDVDNDAEVWEDASCDQPEVSAVSEHGQQINSREPRALEISDKNSRSSTGLSATTFADETSLRLHKAVFDNDHKSVYKILEDKNLAVELVNRRDRHGNTPLHLACMMGRSKEMVAALLEAGADVERKNLQRWTPLAEACSYGDRDIITLLTKQLHIGLRSGLKKHEFSKLLDSTRDYKLELNWEFKSWFPFLSRWLPHDLCTIRKYRQNIRIDTRLVDLESLVWRKQLNSCMIYSHKLGKKWVILNYKTKKYQYCDFNEFKPDIDRQVNSLMRSDILGIEFKSDNIQFNRCLSGWWSKSEKTEYIGRFHADVYNFDQVYIVTRKRREHLDEEQIKQNKSDYNFFKMTLKSGFCKGADTNKAIASDDQACKPDDADGADALFPQTMDGAGNRLKQLADHFSPCDSLPRPPPTNVTWTQYLEAEPPGNFPTLGREQVCKTSVQAWEGSIAMTKEFPITRDELLTLLRIIPLKRFDRLASFIELHLPSGFPVRVDVPILSFLTARVLFHDFEYIDGQVDESLFEIPEGYEEDPTMYPLFQPRMNDEC